MRVCKQSTARNVMVLMIDSTDHITGKTGLTLTITASKDGAAFAGTSPTVTDRGSGWYNLALTTTDTNTLGDLALHVTGAGADPQDVAMQVVAYDPISATNLGLSNLDALISSRMATYTQPTGFLAATFPTGTVANTTNITAGTITTVTNLTNAPTAGDLTATMKASVTTAATAATPTATLSAAYDAAKTASSASAVSGVPAAVLSAASAAPIAADTKKMNGATVNGTGTSGDLWRGA